MATHVRIATRSRCHARGAIVRRDVLSPRPFSAASHFRRAVTTLSLPLFQCLQLVDSLRKEPKWQVDQLAITIAQTSHSEHFLELHGASESPPPLGSGESHLAPNDAWRHRVGPFTRRGCG